MNLTRDRIQSIGWAIVFAVCVVLLAGLTFRVNAVKSEVQLTERKILAVRKSEQFLETEFQTRANQQALTALNEVDFGYQAPSAAQYIEGERQLAALGKPAAPDAPEPIMLASADGVAPAAGSFPNVVAPIAGQRLATGPSIARLSHAAAKPPATTFESVRLAVAAKTRAAAAAKPGIAAAKPVAKQPDARPQAKAVAVAKADVGSKPAKAKPDAKAPPVKVADAKPAAKKAAPAAPAKVRAQTAVADRKPAAKSPAAKSNAPQDLLGGRYAAADPAPAAAKPAKSKNSKAKPPQDLFGERFAHADSLPGAGAAAEQQ